MTPYNSNLVKILKKRFSYLNDEDARHLIAKIFSYISDELSKGNRVEIRGFGSLSLRDKKYASRDDTYKTVYYRMSKNIKDFLN